MATSTREASSDGPSRAKDAMVASLTLLHKPLYSLFKYGLNPETKDLVELYVAGESVWVLEGAQVAVRARLEDETPLYFSDNDEWGNPWTPPYRQGAWKELRLLIPASYGTSPGVYVTSLSQETFDVAAGKVRGKTADDILAVKRLIEARLTSFKDWDPLVKGARIADRQNNRMFLWVEGGGGKRWRSTGLGIPWHQVEGTWQVPE